MSYLCDHDKAARVPGRVNTMRVKSALVIECVAGGPRWRGVVSIPAGPSSIALTDTAYALARYAAIAQVRPAWQRSWRVI